MTSIRIDGLRDFQRALRNVDGTLPRELRLANKKAAEIVAEEARRRAPVKSGKLRKSIKVQAQQRAASVKGGSPKRVPYFGFIDFGGTVGRGGGVKRPFIKEGRIIYPSLAAKRDEVQETHIELTLELMKRAGFNAK